MKQPEVKKNSKSEETLKKESLERLINSYYQALNNSDKLLTLQLKNILKRVGYTKFKL